MIHAIFIFFTKPILKRLQGKAQQAYRDANSGLPPKIPNDIFQPSNPGEETKDELSIFSGKTHTLLTAKSTSSPVASSSTPSSSSNKSRSSSDSPQLVMPDNPSFKGVHPSLVSELNVFNGLIKKQLENAYKAGGDVFGDGEPMVVDGQGSGRGDGGGVHQQSTQMHVVRQQQQQQQQQVMYQPDYQRQHFDKQEVKRLELEREEAANREMERQEMEKHEMERQELARQQQLHQQREIQRQQQQNELLRQQQQAQQQQLDIRRQQEKQQQQQQMQDQYRQQLEVPQHQLQQRQPPSQYHVQRHPYDHDQSPMITEPDQGMVTSSAQPATASPIHTLSHSQSQRNINRSYQQQRPQHYQSMHHPDTAGGVASYGPAPPSQRVTQRGVQQPIRYSTVAQQPQPQQQHSMYAVPPEYSSNLDSIQTGGISYVPSPPSTTSTSTSYLPLTPISASSSPSSYVPQWTAGSYTFAVPDQQQQQATSAGGGSGGGSAAYAWASTHRIETTPEYQQHQQYTPDGALRGIAADDRSLQETWQSYMNKVRTHYTMYYWMIDDADPFPPFFLYNYIGRYSEAVF